MGDRFLVGYPHEGEWRKPPIDVVGALRRPEARGRPERRTREALRLQGLSDHRRGPALRRRQAGGRRRPDHRRARRLSASTRRGRSSTRATSSSGRSPTVFEADGRAVPVFNDKHLSYSFDKAKTMVSTLEAAGLPVPGRLVAAGDLATAERRPADGRRGRGRPHGRRRRLRPDGLPRARGHAVHPRTPQGGRDRRQAPSSSSRATPSGAPATRADGRGSCSKPALSRSDSLQGLTVEDGRTQNLAEGDEIKRLAEHPAAYFIDYADGTKATLLMLNGVLADYNLAVRVKGKPDLLSMQFLLPPNPNVAYSACLMNHVARHVRDRPRRLPRRAHHAGQRHPRKLPGLQGPGP